MILQAPPFAFARPPSFSFSLAPAVLGTQREEPPQAAVPIRKAAWWLVPLAPAFRVTVQQLLNPPASLAGSSSSDFFLQGSQVKSDLAHINAFIRVLSTKPQTEISSDE